AGVAVGAVDLRKIANVDWMLEHLRVRAGDAGGCAFRLRKHGVALVAIAADDASVSADMLAVMATEASAEVEMSEIIRMGLPVQLHLGESRALEDLLRLGDSVSDFELLGLRHVRIFGL